MKTDTVIIEKLIPTSAETLWKAWTEAELILQWFGSDPNGKGVYAKMDVRPGGFFEISFKNADQSQHTCSGIYKEVKPFNKLSFTWQWKAEPGIESFVTVKLTPEQNKVRMQFSHANVGTTSAHNYEAGWQSTFLKLEGLLKK